MSIQAAATLSRLREYAELVKFEHTVFALPFALAAMLLATPVGQLPLAMTVLWVLLAMVGGRTYAMALNRLIDAEIDARNPRTRNRSIPAGRVQKHESLWLAVVSGLILIFATFQLPLICRQLLPAAFAVLTVYSYVKRFSRLAHLVLGVALGSSAVGGWLAVTGELSWLPVIFGFAVVFWVAGFDIIYACQDVDFDRKVGLFSIPASVGVPLALRLSRLLHGMTVLLMLTFGLMYEATGLGYWLATVLMGGMLWAEHRLVSPDNLSRINEAFFVMNGRISLCVFMFVLMDKIFQIV